MVQEQLETDVVLPDVVPPEVDVPPELLVPPVELEVPPGVLAVMLLEATEHSLLPPAMRPPKVVALQLNAPFSSL